MSHYTSSHLEQKVALGEAQIIGSDTEKEGGGGSDDDAFEPTDDTFAETLALGMADGTLRIEDDDEDEEESEDQSTLSTFFLIY